MSYVSFSLKYRPRNFDDVIGQQHVAKTLKNALANDRVAHAYLLTGPRGTGKTTTARILAAALNCEHGPTPDPCGTCDMCKSIIAGNAMDVIEMDAASNRGIDDIRELREKVKFAPATGRYKVYILDEAHMLTTDANNALLKTLEEPPSHVIFVLLTTELNKIIPTILSRCQHFQLRSIALGNIVDVLRSIADKEKISVADAALTAIAHAADGALRDAQSIFDQVVAYADGDITLEVVNEVLGVTDRQLLSRITDRIVAADVAGCFSCVDTAIAEGRDLVRLVEDLTVYMRDLLRLQIGGEAAESLRTSSEATEEMRSQCQALGEQRLLAAVGSLAELQSQLKRSSQHALLVEIGLAELCEPAATTTAAATAQPAQQQPPPAHQDKRGQAVQPAQQATQAATETPAGTQPVATDEPLNLSLIAAHWTEMPAEFNRMGNASLNAMMQDQDMSPVALTGNTLTVGFVNEFRFSRVETAYKDAVEAAASRLFGRPLQVTCRLFESTDELTQAADAARQGSVQPPPENEAQPPAEETAEETAEVETPMAASDTEGEAPTEQDLAAADSAAPTTGDEAVAQTLTLFPGSTELTGDDEETPGEGEN
jgi:DNA polymerase III subunit gamma/tau